MSMVQAATSTAFESSHSCGSTSGTAGIGVLKAAVCLLLRVGGKGLPWTV